MKGVCKIRVRNKHNSYDFTLRRNITILQGESGRGKTTLYEMVAEYERLGRASGIALSSDHPLVTVDYDNWQKKIQSTRDSVILIDEDNEFIRLKSFAELINGSSNYFLLITRSYLPQLPYSVDEIYTLKGKKNKKFVPIYTAKEYLYDQPEVIPFHPDVIITEDSGSGYQFFHSVAQECELECVSAKGKSNIYKLLKQYSQKNVVVIADGAAFGPDMENIVQMQRLHPRNIAIFLPESFEWLILTSGIAGHTTDAYVMHPEEYLESSKFFSWERYFTWVLQKATARSAYKQYSKGKLKEYYLRPDIQKEICANIKSINFK